MICITEKLSIVQQNFWTFVWNMSETLHIRLGRFAPWVFGQMIGSKPVKVTRKSHIFEGHQACQIKDVWFHLKGKEGAMQIKFENGQSYQYFDVPESLYDEFVESKEPGKFLADNVKGNYRYCRV